MILILVVVSLPIQVTSEVKTLAARLRATDPQQIANALESVPFIGDFIAAGVLTFLSDPGSLASVIEEHQAAIFSFATSAARGLLSTAVGIFASLIGCFILYRHGEILVAQLRNILARIGGEGIAKLIDTVHVTVRGAAYSVLLTAIAQGVLAGTGYYIAGAPTPLLLGALTLIISFVPFGPPFVYLPVAAYLFFVTDLPWYHGVGLAIWGTIVVSTVDNVLRPLFISQSTKLSTILVFIGVLGGAASFGLLGVFIGPALVAIAQLFWLELARPAATGSKPSQGDEP
jgi:predicted PurR-regulated permease PerM